MAKLPDDWRLRAVGEEERRNRQRFGLRIGRLAGLNSEETENFLAERAGEPPLEIRERDGHYLAYWATEEARSRMLSLEGRKFRGQLIVVSRQRVKLSADEIFSWVETRLQIAETAQALAGTSVPRVRVISEEEERRQAKNTKKDKPQGEDSQADSPGREDKGWSEKGAKGSKGKGKGKGWSDQKWSSGQWSGPSYGQSYNQGPSQWWGQPFPQQSYQGFQQFPSQGKGGGQQSGTGFNNGWYSGKGWNQPWRPRTPPKSQNGDNFAQWSGSTQAQAGDQATSSKDQPRPPTPPKTPGSPTKGGPLKKEDQRPNSPKGKGGKFGRGRG